MPSGVHSPAALRRICTSAFSLGVAATVHHNSFAETTRCRRHPIGGLRPPMLMCTNSIGGSLRGNTCGAIPLIGETTAGPSTGWKVHASTRSPFAGGCGFPFDPDLHADNTPLVWLPQLDPATVLLIPAPGPFSASRSLGSL